MFGRSHERIVYEYLKSNSNQQESLRRELLRLSPIKSSALLVVGGAVVLKEFSKANLTTPFRNASQAIHQKTMIFHHKVVSDVSDFIASVGDEGLKQVCEALTSRDEEIAIFACFVLLYRTGYSFTVMQELDKSLHNLSYVYSNRIRALIASLIILVQANEGYGNAFALLQSQASRMSYTFKDITHSIIAEAMNYSLPYEFNSIKQTETKSTSDTDLTAEWTHYWNWVDPDNAPWNND